MAQPGLIQIVRELEDEELVLLELQGNIEHSTEKVYNNLYLGKLEKVDEDNYNLYIGNHVIAGKKQKMKNPFVVCEKCKKTTANSEAKIKLKNIINSKIVFKIRPSPILD